MLPNDSINWLAILQNLENNQRQEIKAKNKTTNGQK
jgi:hypothetical protein